MSHSTKTDKDVKELIEFLNASEDAKKLYWEIGLQKLTRVCDNKGWSVDEVLDFIVFQITGKLSPQVMSTMLTHEELVTIAVAMNLFAGYNQRKVDGSGYINRVRRAVFHASVE